MHWIALFGLIQRLAGWPEAALYRLTTAKDWKPLLDVDDGCAVRKLKFPPMAERT